MCFRSGIPAAAVDDIVVAFSQALTRNNSLESLSLGALIYNSYVQIWTYRCLSCSSGLEFGATAAKTLQGAVEVNSTILDISCPALTASGQLKELFRRNRARLKGMSLSFKTRPSYLLLYLRISTCRAAWQALQSADSVG